MIEERIFYLTKQGLEKLQKEQEVLKGIKSAKIKGDVPEVVFSDDLNPEYAVFQEDMERLDARLDELEIILRNVEIIKPPKKEKQGIVDLGATVLVDSGGQKDEFILVGPLEADPASGKISNESPVGRALIGRKVGDAISVASAIATKYKIKKIEYRALTS